MSRYLYEITRSHVPTVKVGTFIIDRGDEAALPGMLSATKATPVPTPAVLPVPVVATAATPDTVS